MKKHFPLIKKITSCTDWYEEETFLSTLAEQKSGQMLDMCCFGRSLFRAGASIPIRSGTWVIQYQISGTAEIRSGEGNCLLQPGNLLVVPPVTPYTYRISAKEDVRKYFIIMRAGPLSEMLLGSCIRQYGIKIPAGPDHGFREIFERIGSLYENMEMEFMEEISVLLYRLFIKIQNVISENNSDQDFYRNLLRAVSIFNEKKCSLDELADIFNMGKHSLIREFRKRTGCSPIAYMIRYRLETARQLLSLSEMSVAEIAACCNYSTASFFISDFKKHTGFTPGEFRRQNKKLR